MASSYRLPSHTSWLLSLAEKPAKGAWASLLWCPRHTTEGPVGSYPEEYIIIVLNNNYLRHAFMHASICTYDKAMMKYTVRQGKDS